MYLLLAALPLLFVAGAFGQIRTVAITVDDLPCAGCGARASEFNHKLIAVFRARRIPVSGFVIQKNVEALGPEGAHILEAWRRAGFDLGNHTYSHADFDNLSVEQMKNEIIRGEAEISRRVFRFPFNHTGDTQAKHDAIAEFLAQRGYSLAPCTIDTSDYVFSAAYVRMLQQGDRAEARRLEREYLSYSAAEIDYYARLNIQALGYEPAEIMLLHANPLNAATASKVMDLFVQRGYRFIPLTQAQSDPAYRTPEKYITEYGPMWGYRWAKERGIRVDGRLEPEPPKWVADYSAKIPR